MKTAVAIVAMLLCVAPALAQNTAKKQAYQDAQNNFSGTSNNFIFFGAVATPATPTASAGVTGGACLSTRTYRLYVSYENATGETDLSHTSIEFTPADSTHRVRVTRGAIGDNVNTWTAWFTTSADNHVTVRGCGASGAVVDTDAATTFVDCLCSLTTDPTEPSANTTADITVMAINSGPTSIDVDMAAGVTIDGKDLTNAAMEDEANTFSEIQSFTAGAYVASDQQLGLEGTAGDSYIKRDLATGFVLIYLDGTLKATVTPNGIIPGECGSDIYSMELGTQCMSNGDLIIVNQAGPWRF